MRKILTVVVPAFNAEPYLQNSLDSFCHVEWLSDIEVLVINDGSTDRTLEIAKKYEELYPDTYRVISKENGGHGSGINCGIENAGGAYFKVVDADDWVEKKAFGKLVNYLKETEDDLVYSGFLWAFDRGEVAVESFEKKPEMEIPFQGVVYEKSYLFDEIAERLYIKMHHITIKTEILRNMGRKIDENCFYVDSEYITYPIPEVKTVSFLPDFVYMYRIGAPGQSVSMERLKRNEQHYDKVIHSLLEFYFKLGNVKTCSLPKKRYLACIIARVIAGKYKIMLCSPTVKETKRQMISFEQQLKSQYPDIYHANVNYAVAILRLSHYSCYSLIAMLVKLKYK